MSKKTDIKLPSVLAFEKKIVPSDAYLYGTSWDARDVCFPLKLQEKTVRGTVSNRLKKAIQDDPMKLNKKIENPNPQTVDICSLGVDQDTLKVCFTLKILGGTKTPSACNKAAFQQSLRLAVDEYVQNVSFRELARRYAINIANARFLWRNRVGAEAIEVNVKVKNEDLQQSWKFDALTFSTRNFDIENGQINSLAALIASVLSSDNDFLLLEVYCFAKVGIAQEVYPSQDLVFNKGNSKSKKSKILYSVDDIAAMHSQKIGNAIRTIDTWYPEFSIPGATAGPIAIEPYGAVTNLGRAFRHPEEKKDFYSCLDKFSRGEKLETVEDEHYVIAVLIRGGVFGESDKEG